MSDEANDAMKGLADILSAFKGEDAKVGELIVSTMMGQITIDMIKNPSLQTKLTDKMFGEGFQYGLTMGLTIAAKIADEIQ